MQRTLWGRIGKIKLLAVPALIDGRFGSRNLGWAAAAALANYGTDANRAIPPIIKAYPLGKSHRFEWKDAAEEAINHLGPADSRDIPELCGLLLDQNHEVQLLAANSLALMGPGGHFAADCA